ncbi:MULTISPECIES: hypothetical protein [unclassified Microcoleus]
MAKISRVFTTLSSKEKTSQYRNQVRSQNIGRNTGRSSYFAAIGMTL